MLLCNTEYTSGQTDSLCDESFYNSIQKKYDYA